MDEDVLARIELALQGPAIDIPGGSHLFRGYRIGTAEVLVMGPDGLLTTEGVWPTAEQISAAMGIRVLPESCSAHGGLMLEVDPEENIVFRYDIGSPAYVTWTLRRRPSGMWLEDSAGLLPDAVKVELFAGKVFWSDKKLRNLVDREVRGALEGFLTGKGSPPQGHRHRHPGDASWKLQEQLKARKHYQDAMESPQ